MSFEPVEIVILLPWVPDSPIEMGPPDLVQPGVRSSIEGVVYD